MHYTLSGEKGSRTILVTLEPGEKVVAALRALGEDLHIRGASVSAIGAVEETELGWFDRDARTYVTRVFPPVMELLSLAGNLSRLDEKVMLHAHAVCAGSDLTAVGGHLVEATCAVTVEAFVQETGFDMTRRLDDRFGLNLLSLDPPDTGR